MAPSSLCISENTQVDKRSQTDCRIWFTAKTENTCRHQDHLSASFCVTHKWHQPKQDVPSCLQICRGCILSITIGLQLSTCWSLYRTSSQTGLTQVSAWLFQLLTLWAGDTMIEKDAPVGRKLTVSRSSSHKSTSWQKEKKRKRWLQQFHCLQLCN